MSEAPQGGRQFGFLLVDKFSMFSLAAAIDTFRSANRLLGAISTAGQRFRLTANPSWRRTVCR